MLQHISGGEAFLEGVTCLVVGAAPGGVACPVGRAGPGDVACPVGRAGPGDVACPVGRAGPGDVAWPVGRAGSGDVACPMGRAGPGDVACPVGGAAPLTSTLTSSWSLTVVGSNSIDTFRPLVAGSGACPFQMYFISSVNSLYCI